MSEVAVPVRMRLDDALARAVDWLTLSHLRAVAALVAVCLICFLPGLGGIQPIDRDEPRFVQATKQMLETGNFVDIRMHDEPRYKKPVGIYWLQAAMVTLTGHGADAPLWAYRLTSVAGALAAVLLLYWATLGLFDRRAAFYASMLFATSLIVTVEAHLAKTDAVLVATVVLAQGALARIYRWEGEGRPPISTALLFWLGIGLGFLIKGPVIVMVSGLTIASLVIVDRRWRWLANLRPLVGVPLALIIVLPWFVAILSIAGTAFLQQSVGNDLLGKVATGQEGHWAPPGTHFLLFWGIFWPGAALAAIAAPWVWHHRRDASVRFALAWIIPSWVVFEAVATKLPHHTLPLYPAVAALIGAAASAGLDKRRIFTAVAISGAAILAIALPIAGVAGLFWLNQSVSPGGVAVIVVIIAIAATAVFASVRGSPVAATALLVLSALVTYPYLLTAVLPDLTVFRVSPRLAAAAAAAAPCGKPEVLSAGYQEPSLIFLVGTDIRFANGKAAADFLAEGGCKVALVDDRQADRFAARAVEIGLATETTTVVDGINLGHFGRVAISVVRAKAVQSPGAPQKN